MRRIIHTVAALGVAFAFTATARASTITDVGQTSLKVSGLTCHTQYRVRVEQRNASNTGWTSLETFRPTTAACDQTPPNCAAQPFCADFETGTVAPWHGPTNEGTGTITVGTTNVKQGVYSARFQTNAGTGNQRAEIYATQSQTGGYPGQDWYYGWWSYFPSINGLPQQWWPDGGGWNDIAQFQSVDWTAFMYLGIDQGNYTPGSTSMYMNWAGHHVLDNPLQYDHWYHFVMHAHWSTGSDGLIELDVDGARKLTLNAPTLLHTTVVNLQGSTAPGAYAELDLYHGGTFSTNLVYHDGFCRAASYAAAAAC